MKTAFITFVLLFTGLYASSKTVYTKADSTRVVHLLEKGRKQPSGTNLMTFFAREFLNVPYVAHTLDKTKNENLVVNLHQLDCTTYVENVLALSWCVKNKHYTFKAFCDVLRKVRYIDGKVAYTARKHYFTTWAICNAQAGFIDEIQAPNPPFGATQTVKVNYMSTHVSQYYMLSNTPSWTPEIKRQESAINGKTFKYIPNSKLQNNQTLRRAVHDGDIIAIVTKINGLDISHLGIASWRSDGLHLLNASMVHKKVVDESMTLAEYMKKHSSHLGIRVMRMR